MGSQPVASGHQDHVAGFDNEFPTARAAEQLRGLTLGDAQGIMRVAVAMV